MLLLVELKLAKRSRASKVHHNGTLAICQRCSRRCRWKRKPLPTRSTDAFEHTLPDSYYAENAIAKSLLKVIEAVSNNELKAALKDHLAETKAAGGVEIDLEKKQPREV